MSVKVTELDVVIARNLRRFREEARLSQPQVAGFLGVTYQSYQKMEGGRVSFRASAIDRLCELYGVQYTDLTRDDEETHVSPHAVTLIAIIGGFDEGQQQELLEHAVKLKHRETN